MEDDNWYENKKRRDKILLVISIILHLITGVTTIVVNVNNAMPIFIVGIFSVAIHYAQYLDWKS